MDIGFGAHASRNMRRVPRFMTGLGAYLGALDPVHIPARINLQELHRQ